MTDIFVFVFPWGRPYLRFEWPSKSPDFNPKENIWGAMTVHINQLDVLPTTVQELKDAVDVAYKICTADEVRRRHIAAVPGVIAKSIIQRGGDCYSESGQRQISRVYPVR